MVNGEAKKNKAIELARILRRDWHCLPERPKPDQSGDTSTNILNISNNLSTNHAVVGQKQRREGKGGKESQFFRRGV